MKLRNKGNGEIVSLQGELLYDDKVRLINYYGSLAKLNEEWEDAPEEPKGSALDMMVLTLANFIENEPDEDKVDLEDCKQMLEKLKALKRLKDKGFMFIGKTYETDKRFGSIFYKVDDDTYSEDIIHELDLLFGGEE